MSWAKSLIKLSTYEVEILQKRLADIADRRVKSELRLAFMAAQGESETENARQNAEVGYQLAGFLAGLKVRMEAVQAEIEAIQAEEAGARDALAQAFETQKKYELIAEQMRVAEVKETGRRETAAFDELGLRKTGRR
jgi:flagellar FliJ protein